MPHKYPANGESRIRLDDSRHRRASPPDRKLSPRQQILSPGIASPPGGQSTPPIHPNRGSPVGRREETRRSDEYHRLPENAHQPPAALPAQPPQSDVAAPAAASDQGRDDREAFEAAARKMDVDENYDDEGEEEKRKVASGEANSPQRAAGAGPPPVQAEA